MYYYQKQKIVGLFGTMRQMLRVLCTLYDPRFALRDCAEAIDAISALLLLETPLPLNTLRMLDRLREDFVALEQGGALNAAHGSSLTHYWNMIEQSLHSEIHIHLKAVFFPHTAASWRHMEPVFQAVSSDPDCRGIVLPPPYYLLGETIQGPFCDYEVFPKHLPLARYYEYNLEDKQPDLMFLSNVYDQYHPQMRLHEAYFATSLVKHTSMAVFMPMQDNISENLGLMGLPRLPTAGSLNYVAVHQGYPAESALRDGFQRQQLLPYQISEQGLSGAVQFYNTLKSRLTRD